MQGIKAAADGMVTIFKAGEEKIRILAENLEEHIKLGWIAVADEPPAQDPGKAKKTRQAADAAADEPPAQDVDQQ
ncbi:hypothetical protein BUE93_20795 [Chromobacterium amazonense]|uniref:Uncharacterized protein n=1 Tax=Chromobacterium amazonense TaxID=1382803 RepID=A0A2S9WZ82_9NEIS|nr:hypothetical protein [Chromobacterium amazonense]PRP68706.1 hypothetical protein BUE93_20795 [Chromobacterium amazonense]